MTSLLDAWFEHFSVRVVTINLVEQLMLGMALTPTEMVNFGVETEGHYRALQTMVRNACGEVDIEDEKSGCIPEALCQIIVELDDALRNGAKLNALVRKYVPEYGSVVRFHTAWDVLIDHSVEAAHP